ncbi:serine peptidase [Kitasatospora griseola]|uniref:serine peptidase n=1 Tax=Kitasatospora griseola TaxID=2064 RepID=UPI0038560218
MTSETTSPLRVVAVHGIYNSFGTGIPDARKEELRALKAAAWARDLAAALAISPERLDIDFAYYADRLRPGPAAQGEQDGDFLDDPLAQEILDVWARELGLPEEVAQGHAAVPLRGFASWMARRFDLAEGPLGVFIRLLCGEVAAYLRSADAPERIAAREEVAARIARHRPRVVVAHSLGSVVAYEALHAHPELRPELFLTLGSPLALPRVVFERLVPAPRPADSPQLRGVGLPGGTRWVNIADPGDPVAVPPKLDRFFDGIALDLTSTISAHYRFHHADNYLRCATTAATIGPYLGI